MRRLAFITAIAGLFILLLVFTLSPPKQASTTGDITNLENNERVVVSGVVVEERSFGTMKIIKLDNNIEIITDKGIYLVNKTILALGKITDFTGQRRVSALKIKILT
ncbi:hypothetical protein KW787_00620 [Candidatus Pacearchaeota archaeon]|nr:hypothetical protein [Candidatus Pacearchaeota archaeon]